MIPHFGKVASVFSTEAGTVSEQRISEHMQVSFGHVCVSFIFVCNVRVHYNAVSHLANHDLKKT